MQVPLPMLALADAVIPVHVAPAVPPPVTEPLATQSPEPAQAPFNPQVLWVKMQGKAINILIMTWHFLTVLAVAAPQILVKRLSAATRTTLRTGVGIAGGVVQEFSSAVDETLDLNEGQNVTAGGPADIRQDSIPKWLVLIMGAAMAKHLS